MFFYLRNKTFFIGNFFFDFLSCFFFIHSSFSLILL